MLQEKRIIAAIQLISCRYPHPKLDNQYPDLFPLIWLQGATLGSVAAETSPNWNQNESRMIREIVGVIRILFWLRNVTLRDDRWFEKHISYPPSN